MTRTRTRPEPVTYRLGSTPMVSAPGIVLWALNGARFPRDLPAMVNVISGTWNLPKAAARALLTGAVPHSIDREAETVEFTYQPGSRSMPCAVKGESISEPAPEPSGCYLDSGGSRTWHESTEAAMKAARELCAAEKAEREARARTRTAQAVLWELSRYGTRSKITLA